MNLRFPFYETFSCKIKVSEITECEEKLGAGMIMVN